MSLTVISEDFINEEISVQKEIHNSIDRNESIIFNAGAGAGKTYALIESLKYIVNNYGFKLQKHNQKVVCITYTNVAVDEIKERLGYSEVVDVSTIHEKLWSFIKQHQRELLIVHSNKIKENLQELTRNLNENEDVAIEKIYRVYRNLPDELQVSFKDYIIDKKDVFYKAYSRNAAGFKAAFNGELDCYENILRSVGNFKKVVSTIYKIENYKYCLQKIEEKNNDYIAVRYDSKFNTDILHKMLFSHDTLIEYALEMVKKYDLLKQIIGDSHPFILIDEYQDTSPLVIEIMQLLSTHSLKIKHDMFIGYFGDKAQNIYDDGVGSNITSLHPGLRDIKKRFNRRSTSEIISVINKIRCDEIEQESIYEDCTGGSVKFYHSQAVNKKEEIDSFISKYTNDWDINKDKKLHCLVLTNKLIAELSGFAKLYSVFSGSQYYRKNFQYINSELLSHDLGKLGRIPSILYKIIKFKTLLKNPKTPLTALFSEEVYSLLSFAELNKLIQQLKSISGDNLSSCLHSIFNLYELGDNNVKKAIREAIDLEEEKLLYDGFFGYVLEQLTPNLDYENEAEFNIEKEKLEGLFSLGMEEYEIWYNFINDRQDSDIIYHTYHGTKGIEFNNVIIIMENSFGRDNRKFLNYFLHVIDPSGLEDNAKCKFENTKNLLYVSCSRAIKNLRVLYLDDISMFTEGVEHIFGEALPYTSS